MAALILCCLLAGCTDVTGEIPDKEEQATEFSVSFFSEGKKYYGAVVNKGGYVGKPAKDPEKPSYRFTGWYSDEECTQLFDFSTPITKSIILYSNFVIDETKILEGLEKLNTSFVKISNKSFNVDKDGKETESVTEEAVGFIFNVSNGYFFAITNHHATVKRNGFNQQEVTVTDFKGRTYQGRFYAGRGGRATSSDYDLSVVCCEYNKTDLKAAPISKTDVQDEQIIFARGFGKDEVAYGSVGKLDLATVPMEEYLSNITFEVIHHNALLDNVEGIVFNLDHQIVGFTYANDGGVSYAIPAQRIYDFLYAFVYK